jgi:hypothetical protein
MPTYLVETICTGTIRESWRVTSSRPLSDDDIREVMGGHTTNDGVDLEFLAQDTSDEENREVTSWASEETSNS